MIDQEFCEFLEYELSKAFKQSTNAEIKSFWCDGITLSESDKSYSKETVSANGKIHLKAFIGKDGQTECSLTLNFGHRALSQFAQDLDIRNCFSKLFEKDGFFVDIKEKKIELELD